MIVSTQLILQLRPVESAVKAEWLKEPQRRPRQVRWFMIWREGILSLSPILVGGGGICVVCEVGPFGVGCEKERGGEGRTLKPGKDFVFV